ncbi:pyridoxal-dependent decarboxylase [Vibrio sinaloensis]|uniref:pyridoxal-dependent decarboxylase n=1 Tax=Photobacterium sp. (strain ATCC 43367) TaxID=379097 RepID=UPI00057ED231|nr:pyridoxal-dependent decarboxylase [Vibrio sinaloensis]KHT39141.1 glutamate decarboxylase [Vibrio sinaloensis]
MSDNKEIEYGPKRIPWEHQVPDFAKERISPPSADPIQVYAERNYDFHYTEQAINGFDVELPPSGQSCQEQNSVYEQILAYVDSQKERFLGYQTEENISYKTRLAPFLNVSLNNVGDPFVNGNYTINSKCVERSVLDYYASLWNATWPSQGPYIDENGDFQKGVGDSYWGYVLTMGSTEGNLYGMLNARDYLSGVMLLEEEIRAETDKGETICNNQVYAHYPKTPLHKPNAYTPVAFFSEDTHYSIVKAMAVEKIETFGDLGNRLYPDDNPVNPGQPWPMEVESEGPTETLPAGSGAIDVDKLIAYVSFFASKGYPILIVLNCGTTFKGAYDDVDTVTQRLEPILKEHDLWEREVLVDPDDPASGYEKRTGYWLHIDGALGGSYVPFIKMAKESGRYRTFFAENNGYTGPNFDFSNPMVHSIVTSGHKWPGAPWPTGVYMTKQKYMVSPPDDPEYIGSPDTTFAGSRNGLSPLVLWEYFARNSFTDQMKMTMRAQEMALYAHNKLTEVADYWDAKFEGNKSVSFPEKLWLQRTPLSLSLIFCQPNEEIIFRYSLAKESTTVKVERDGKLEDEVRHYVHLFTMWDVDEQLIDNLCQDLMQDDAFNPDLFPKVTSQKLHKARVKNSLRQVRLPLKGRSFR